MAGGMCALLCLTRLVNFRAADVSQQALGHWSWYNRSGNTCLSSMTESEILEFTHDVAARIIQAHWRQWRDWKLQVTAISAYIIQQPCSTKAFHLACL